MKQLPLIFIALIIFLGQGCLKKEPTAIEKLYSRNSKDPVETMRLKPRLGKGKKKSFKKTEQLNSFGGSSAEKLSSDLAPLNRLSKPPAKKIITILANTTSFRQGPGTKYKEVGKGRKGDQFQLLQVKQDESGGKWYLAQDKREKKFFVSSVFTTLKKQKNLQKETMNGGGREQALKKLKKVVNSSPPLPPELKEAKNITLNFEDTDIYDVITTFCELLKLDYIIEGQVSGKVTLQTFNKIAVEDLYSVLEQILALNNFTVVQSGNFYRFLPITEAVKKPLSIYYGKDAIVPPNERLVIQIIPLRHISSQSMKKIVAPLLTKNASFIEIPETNNLMMIELASNVGRILKVVGALDIDKLASSDIGLYTIKNSDATLIVSELEEVFSALGYEETVGQSLNFLPLERLNAILVVNPFKSILPTIEFWIEKLDQPIVSEAQLSTFVYYAQFSDADKLAAVLTKIFQSTTRTKKTAKQIKLLKSRPSSASKSSTASKTPANKTTSQSKSKKRVSVTGGLGRGLSSNDDDDEELTIVSNKDTNSLIIRTTARKYPAILELLSKLDIKPKQVLLEVLILDLNLNKTNQLGIDWAALGKLENAQFGTGSQFTNVLDITSAAAGIPAPFGFSVANASKFRALITALATDGSTNILSNPTLVTTNNKSASIAVETDFPIPSSSTTLSTGGGGGPSTVSEIEFKKVGINLSFTPKINSDNFISLAINQTISSVGAPVQGTNTSSFNVRRINTEVILEDNQVLVMGGLMEERQIENKDGIPGLKDIPFFGRLFSGGSTSNQKTELMVFVTPHIINSVQDADYVTKTVKGRLKNLGRTFDLN
jgi:general secretion pathway protein D